ncbi:MAG: HesA/MoeB/ThiF family protein [Flavobacteriales bacterium]|nr:HesA/MoeB/ThiF family protein [Bacteroidota bacterium]MCB9241913.1 HesA/MoeB/ThiF family protein [Flavobacteriales bacterium]
MTSRYVRQQILPEIGIEGQTTIQAGRVLIIGAGGLGTHVAAHLVASGVGVLNVIDFDVVEESNLHRQLLFTPHDVGRPKAQVLAQKLQNQNPTCTVNGLVGRVEEVSSSLDLSNYDVVCDCTDNLGSRQHINAMCKQATKPLVYAALTGWEGYVTVLHHQRNIDLNDAFQLTGDGMNVLDCAVNGVMSTTCGLAGTLQANEVLKLLIGSTEVLDGKILCFNALKNVFRTFRLNS